MTSRNTWTGNKLGMGLSGQGHLTILQELRKTTSEETLTSSSITALAQGLVKTTMEGLQVLSFIS